MVKAVDYSKFLKTIDKSKTIGRGFHDPQIWVPTGHYLLNYFISGRFDRGIPLGKFTMLAGDSGCLPRSATVFVKRGDSPSEKITVEELKESFHSGEEIYIDTPDGWVQIIDWFDKGELDMMYITTSNHATRCAVNHMLQLESGLWKPASSVKVGDILLTDQGGEEVLTVEGYLPEECYDFTVDHYNHRYYGDGFSSHNSGKSFICSGALVRHAQQMGITPVIIDTENAIDEEWLIDLGVDTSPDKLMKFNLAKVNDVAKVLSEFVDWYKTQYDGLERSERPPFLFIIDSLGMTITDNEEKQFNNGEMKGDMGLKAKQLNSLVRNCVHMISEYDIGVVATNHTYASQDMFDPEDKLSGGRLLEYGASILVAMKKKKDKDGAQVTGINSKCKVMKSRYGRPFITADVIIDFKKGVNPYSGLLDFFIELGVVQQGGAYATYIDNNGEEFKDYKSKFKNEWLDKAMAEFDYEKYALKSRMIAEKELTENQPPEEPDEADQE